MRKEKAPRKEQNNKKDFPWFTKKGFVTTHYKYYLTSNSILKHVDVYLPKDTFFHRYMAAYIDGKNVIVNSVRIFKG